MTGSAHSGLHSPLHRAVLLNLLKWTALGAITGILAGSASAAFLALLTLATNYRIAHPHLLFLLPVCGLLVGMAYRYWGASVERGNNLILDHIHEPGGGVPFRMAPLILASTVLTHLFGGSAGREGTAVQMGGSLASLVSRVLKRHGPDSRLLLMSGVSAGFGAVFGTPLAGAVFGMEVQTLGRIRYDGIIPCLVGSIVGDRVCRAWGIHHSEYTTSIASAANMMLLIKMAVAGVAFGITALLFSELTHWLADIFARYVGYAPLRPFIGGLLVIALTYTVGSYDYLGLSLPLIEIAIKGGQVAAYAFALKLVFTSVTLASGFKGGEVTPLFVIGATLGNTLGQLLGGPIQLFAAAGFVSVFGAAANTPLSCVLMAVELFGGAPALPIGVACILAYLFSGHKGIYRAQRLDTPKIPGSATGSAGFPTGLNKKSEAHPKGF